MKTCGPIALQAPCDPIIGYYWSEELVAPGNLNEFFCVEKGTSFMIGVGSAGGTSVRFTCQNGQTNPQTVTITLNAPPAKPFWQTNGDC